MTHWLDDATVAVVREAATYGSEAPYHPSEEWPEWRGTATGRIDNPAYRGVRQLLSHLGLDRAHFGSLLWNPLSEIIQRGQTVLMKPNLVAHRNIGDRAFGTTDTVSLITHGSIIRVVADYVAKALEGSGTIIVADCPLQGTDWEQVRRMAGLPEIQVHFQRAFPGIDFRIEDYRLATARTRSGWVAERLPSRRSATEYVEIDLAGESLLVPLMARGADSSFGVTQYPRWRMRAAHSPDRNTYVVPKTVLSCDAFINLPKMKTHQKAGMTGALKNLVGINGHKDHLPHFRYGSPDSGGDEYPDGGPLWDLMWYFHHLEWELDGGRRKQFYRACARATAAALRITGTRRHFLWLGGGSWHGNDTIWRTVLDLNRLFFYYDPASGRLGPEPRKDIAYLAILDGIVGGQQEGPLAPFPIRSGWLIGGRNPVAVDAVATGCMGFDIDKVSMFAGAFGLDRFPLTRFATRDIRIRGWDRAESLQDIYSRRLFTPFQPSLGYRGHIEYRYGENGQGSSA